MSLGIFMQWRGQEVRVDDSSILNSSSSSLAMPPPGLPQMAQAPQVQLIYGLVVAQLEIKLCWHPKQCPHKTMARRLFLQLLASLWLQCCAEMTPSSSNQAIISASLAILGRQARKPACIMGLSIGFQLWDDVIRLANLSWWSRILWGPRPVWSRSLRQFILGLVSGVLEATKCLIPCCGLQSP